MQWTTPDFVEITLCMEVTAYVNTGEAKEDDLARRGSEETVTLACAAG